MHYLLSLIFLSVAYVLTGKLGLLLALPPGHATAIWPPSGIALAAVLALGYRVWPAIFLGSVVLNFSTALQNHHGIFSSSDWLGALLQFSPIGLGASLQACVAAYLVRRYSHYPDILQDTKQIVLFLCLAGPLACVIAASGGVFWLSQLGILSHDTLAINWATWWAGDMIGVIFFTPLCLVILDQIHFDPKKKLTFISTFLLCFAITALLFLYASRPSNIAEAAAINLNAWLVLSTGFLFSSLISIVMLVLFSRNMAFENLLGERTKDIKKYEALLSRTSEIADVGGWEYDLEQDQLIWSEHMYDIYEVTQDFQPSIPAIEAMNDPKANPVLFNSFVELVESGQAAEIEFDITTPKGNTKRLRSFGSPFIKDGKVIKIYGAVQNISDYTAMAREKQNLQQQLQQAQKMEAVGQLAGGISHDFNNILQGIIGYTSLAQTECENHPEHQVLAAHLHKIMESAERARNLVTKILAFSRTDLNNATLLDLETEIRVALTMMQPTLPPNIHLTFTPCRQPLHVLCDQTHLHQIIINLLVNARDALDGKGSIKVQLEHMAVTDQSCASCRQVFSGDYAVIRVTDSGPGITSELQKKIFEPFFTTKPVGQGTGMGLAVVHGIVHQHHGHIMLNTDAGSVFQICLPLNISAQPDVPMVPSSPTRAGSNSGTLLIVDDERLITDMLTHAFHEAGYSRVMAFNHPREALAYYQKHSAEISIVISDQTMPDMTGFELARNILAIDPQQAVILFTGYDKTLDEQQALTAGVRYLLKKPLNPDHLLRIMAHLLTNSD